MTVKCLYNHGKSVKNIEKYQHYSDQTQWNMLDIGKTYYVAGIYSRDNIIHYLVDDGFEPWTAEEFLFEVVDNTVPQKWYFNSRPQEDLGRIIIGYKELCFDKNYIIDLLEREKYAIDIYWKRKKEMYPDLKAN